MVKDVLLRVKSKATAFINDEQGGEVPTTAIIAAILGVAAVGIAGYILVHVKSTTNAAGNTIDQAAQQQY